MNNNDLKNRTIEELQMEAEYLDYAGIHFEPVGAYEKFELNARYNALCAEIYNRY